MLLGLWSWAMLTCGCLSKIKSPGLAADGRCGLARQEPWWLFLLTPPGVPKDTHILEQCHTFWSMLKLGDVKIRLLGLGRQLSWLSVEWRQASGPESNLKNSSVQPKPVAHACDSRVRVGRDRGIPGAYQPDNLSYLGSSRPVKDPVSKDRGL